ncbi:hypothetical protein EXIGLDRAFT_699160 [Exidia glandulosa HHB12029]|uniref:BTB domain-containing protein n=1 Tax=Exidia glandulosa HHB12029 TaxID=1314781 RepID=A0A165Q8Q7_EXIGL|nr:hypothetical protein EXIGLDRAFT_699160 [Exidia glandulosa HHB12029]
MAGSTRTGVDVVNPAAVTSPDSYHPEFSDEGDIVLLASDSVRFRIPTTVLRRASGFFRSMFDSAQPDHSTPSGEPSVISVDEDARTMAIILKVASGLPVEFLKAFTEITDIDRIALAADKYDIPAVLRVLELAMYAPSAKAHPLHRYAMASRYGWHDVCVEAAVDTLDMDLNFQNVPSMDMEHLARLLRLRYRRVHAMAAALEDQEGQFAVGNKGACLYCGKALARPTAWENMKRYLLCEITFMPSGSTIRLDDPCCQAVKDATCTECPGGAPLFDWVLTERLVDNMIASLPTDLD